MIVSEKTHKKSLAVEKDKAKELHTIIIRIFEIALQFKSGKIASWQAVKRIWDILDANKELIFNGEHEIKENPKDEVVRLLDIIRGVY